MDGYYTASQTAQLLKLTKRRVVRMIVEDGIFPGARKLDPAVEKSPYIIPVAEVDAEIKRRAQSGD